MEGANEPPLPNDLEKLRTEDERLNQEIHRKQLELDILNHLTASKAED